MKTKIKNHATLSELNSIINEFKNIIISSTGVEKDFFTKLLIENENDLKTGNYKK